MILGGAFEDFGAGLLGIWLGRDNYRGDDFTFGDNRNGVKGQTFSFGGHDVVVVRERGSGEKLAKLIGAQGADGRPVASEISRITPSRLLPCESVTIPDNRLG